MRLTMGRWVLTSSTWSMISAASALRARGDWLAVMAMVAGGLGYSVLAGDFAAPWLADGRLVDLLPGRWLDQDVALAWYPRREMPAYFRALIDAVD